MSLPLSPRRNLGVGLLLLAGAAAAIAAAGVWQAGLEPASSHAMVALLLLAVALLAWAGMRFRARRAAHVLEQSLAALRRGEPGRPVQPQVAGGPWLSLAAQVDGLSLDWQAGERRWQEQAARQRERTTILEHIAQDGRLADTLTSLVQWVEVHSPARVSVLQLAPDGQAVLACVAPGLPAGWAQAMLTLPLETAAGACFQAVSERRLVVSLDVQVDPQWTAVRAMMLREEIRACWSLPVFSPGGRILGAFALMFRERQEADPDLLQLAQEAADLAALAIDRDQVRTTLTQAEAGYRHLFEAGPRPMWVAESGSGQLLAVNDQALALYGYTRPEFLALTQAGLEVPDLSGRVPHFDWAEAQPSAPTVRHHHRKDGSAVGVHLVSSPLHFRGHDARVVLVESVDEP